PPPWKLTAAHCINFARRLKWGGGSPSAAYTVLRHDNRFRYTTGGRVPLPVGRAGFKPVGGRQASSVGSTPASSAPRFAFSFPFNKGCAPAAVWLISSRGNPRPLPLTLIGGFA